MVKNSFIMHLTIQQTINTIKIRSSHVATEETNVLCQQVVNQLSQVCQRRENVREVSLDDYLQ